MSNRRFLTPRQATFKQVDVGKAVVLDDQYLVEHHKDLRMEAIALQTMQNAEDAAQALIDKAREEAQEIIMAAQAKANEILEEEGYKQRDAVRQQAYEEGFQTGLEQGYAKIAEEVADKIQSADLIIEKAYEAERLLVHSHQEQMVELLRYLLSLILKHELNTNPQQMIGLIEKAAETIQFTGHAKVIINPETLQNLKNFAPEVLTALSEQRRMTLQPDASCGPFEMYLETLEGAYNISAESQAEIFLKTVSKHMDVSPDPMIADQVLPHSSVEILSPEESSLENPDHD